MVSAAQLWLYLQLTLEGQLRCGTINAVKLEDRIEEGTSNPEILDFLRCAWQWDPRQRPSAAQLLGHAWLQ